MLTRAAFRARYPEFAKATDPLVDAKLLDAADRIGPAYGDQENLAHGLLTAHLIAISPLGKDMKLQASDGSTVYQFEYLTIARTVAGGPHGW